MGVARLPQVVFAVRVVGRGIQGKVAPRLHVSLWFRWRVLQETNDPFLKIPTARFLPCGQSPLSRLL